MYYQGKWKKLGPHNLKCWIGRKNWKKRKPSATITSTEGVAKKAKTEGGDDEKIKEDTNFNTKEGDVKDENKDQVKPSVVLDKNKWLDVHVPVTSGNVIDFQSLQGLINIHFHFHNK